MNSSKINFIGSFADCLFLFNHLIISSFLIFLFLLLIPSAANATFTVTLQLESADSDVIAGHKVYLRKEAESYNFTSPAWEGSDTICTISGLEEDTTYYFIARTYDNGGNTSDNSNEIKFRQDSEKSASTDTDSTTSTDTDSEQSSDDSNVVPKEGPVLTSDTLDLSATEQGQLGSTQWRIYRDSDNQLVFDTTLTPATNEIQVPRLILENETLYTYTTRLILSGGQAEEWTAKQNFIDTNIMAADANTNGIPDEQEVDSDVDVDGDGTADQDQENMLTVKASSTDEHIGISLGNNGTSVSIQAVETVSLNELSIKEDIDVAPEMTIGLINVRIMVENAGDEVEVTYHLPSSTDSNTDSEWGAWWYCYDNIHGWKDCSTLLSTESDNDTKIVKLTDGGDEDADGVKNGVIVTQSGPATSPSQGIGGGGSSRACFIDTLFQ